MILKAIRLIQKKEAIFLFKTKFFTKETTMKKLVLLGLGTVALAGLLGKRYLDKQKANPNNLYDDYKEAIVGESGKFVLKGLKGIAEGLSLGYEKLLGEAKFNDEFDEESFEKMVRARQELCGHLNGQALAPELAKSERFAWAKLSTKESPA